MDTKLMRQGSSHFFTKTTLALAIYWLLAPLQPAEAVILGKADGTANASAPADDPGWNRVGIVNGSSAVYLGNDYVLSARHVDAGNLTLGSTTYTLDTGFAPQYLQTQSSPSQFADLVIFKINSGPTMDFIPIYGGTSEAGMTATYIGIGRDRGSAVSGQGWLWGSTTTKRWGQNVIDSVQTVDQGDVFYQALVSDFDRVGTGFPGLPEENHAAIGDSGGALFVKDAGIWKLAGIMTSVTEDGRSFYDGSPLPGAQPDELYSVRLSAYDDWVISVIPEPRAWSLLAAGMIIVGIQLIRRSSK